MSVEIEFSVSTVPPTEFRKHQREWLAMAIGDCVLEVSGKLIMSRVTFDRVMRAHFKLSEALRIWPAIEASVSPKGDNDGGE